MFQTGSLPGALGGFLVEGKLLSKDVDVKRKEELFLVVNYFFPTKDIINIPIPIIIPTDIIAQPYAALPIIL